MRLSGDFVTVITVFFGTNILPSPSALIYISSQLDILISSSAFMMTGFLQSF